MPKSLTEATQKAEKTVREGKVEWAHHLSMTSPSDGDFSHCDPRTVSFLETNINETTFIYESGSQATTGNLSLEMVRMCIRGGGNGSSSYVKYHVDMPVHNVFRYTNANTLKDAADFLTLAASAGALNAFVMHNQYWGTQTTSVSCLAGEIATFFMFFQYPFQYPFL